MFLISGRTLRFGRFPGFAICPSVESEYVEIMEYWWDCTDKETPSYSEKNLPPHLILGLSNIAHNNSVHTRQRTWYVMKTTWLMMFGGIMCVLLQIDSVGVLRLRCKYYIPLWTLPSNAIFLHSRRPLIISCLFFISIIFNPFSASSLHLLRVLLPFLFPSIVAVAICLGILWLLYSFKTNCVALCAAIYFRGLAD